jgi:hypothetical protein
MNRPTTNHTPPLGASPGDYRPRNAQDSILVHVLSEHLEEFVARADSDDPNWRLPRFVEDQLHAMTHCGDFLRGFVRLECDTCRAPRIVPFS